TLILGGAEIRLGWCAVTRLRPRFPPRTSPTPPSVRSIPWREQKNDPLPPAYVRKSGCKVGLCHFRLCGGGAILLWEVIAVLKLQFPPVRSIPRSSTQSTPSLCRAC